MKRWRLKLIAITACALKYISLGLMLRFTEGICLFVRILNRCEVSKSRLRHIFTWKQKRETAFQRRHQLHPFKNKQTNKHMQLVRTTPVRKCLGIICPVRDQPNLIQSVDPQVNDFPFLWRQPANP